MSGVTQEGVQQAQGRDERSPMECEDLEAAPGSATHGQREPLHVSVPGYSLVSAPQLEFRGNEDTYSADIARVEGVHCRPARSQKKPGTRKPQQVHVTQGCRL